MKYLAIIFMFVSTSAFANIPIRDINHTTIMTKDALIVLDRRAGTFWKVETSCDLPLTVDSNVRFMSDARVIRKGTEVTFLIDSKRNKHKCSVEKVSLFSQYRYFLNLHHGQSFVLAVLEFLQYHILKQAQAHIEQVFPHARYELNYLIYYVR